MHSITKPSHGSIHLCAAINFSSQSVSACVEDRLDTSERYAFAVTAFAAWRVDICHTGCRVKIPPSKNTKAVLKVKVKCHQNLVTLGLAETHIDTEFHQFLLSSFSAVAWTDRHTDRQTS